MNKIGSTSKLFLEKNKARLVIRKPLLEILLSFLGLSIWGCVVFSFVISEKFEYQNLIFQLFFLLGIFQCIYMIGLSEESEINIEQRSLTRKKKLLGINIKTITFTWAENYYFKYEVESNSYKQITAIWLVVCLTDKKETRQLLRFFHQKSFIAFQKLFNNQFPEHKILEWHD